jgi:hypothetical protein
MGMLNYKPAVSHRHTCKKCGRTWNGYGSTARYGDKFKCTDGPDTLCASCLCNSFRRDQMEDRVERSVA